MAAQYQARVILSIRSGWNVSEIILAYALEVLKIQEYVVCVCGQLDGLFL